ncbi:hypothetical protein DL93DRAFT_1161018 [Clavulina sp. PMI_390]|nr:hypothetical protein DL93DRAFT_1161018 [Clavulina sp. PMI_390]
MDGHIPVSPVCYVTGNGPSRPNFGGAHLLSSLVIHECAFTGSNSKELLGAVLRVEVDLDDHAIALHDQDVEDGEILALPGKGDDKGGDDPFTDGAANGEHGEQDAMAEEGGQEEEGDEREAGETTDLLPQHSSGSVRSRGRRLRRPTVDTQLASTAAGAAPGLTVAPATSVEEAEADEVLTALPSGAPVLPVGAPLARGRYVSMPSSRSAPVHGLGSALPRTPTRPGQRYRSRDRSQVGGLRGLAEESNVNGGSVAGAGAGGYGFGLVGGASPLARTFSRTVHGAPANDGALVAVLKRLEGAVAGLSASAPASTTAAVAGAGAKGNGEKRKADTDTEKEVAELRKEMKDVTERQARIEELLMSLTRQMRS